MHMLYVNKRTFSVYFIFITFSFQNVAEIDSNELRIKYHYIYNIGALFTKYNYVLLGNTIRSVFVPSIISCNQQCLAEIKCSSFNYNFNKEENEALALCELKRTTDDGENLQQNLQFKPGYLFTLVNSKRQMPSSCLDHLRNGALQSGVYEINDHDNVRYQVYCDLSSEPGMAWTLVVSQAFSNRNLESFKNPLSINYPINQKSPRWDAYRLSLLQMNKLKSGSSHWRITCNFNNDGLFYRDYVRARFDDFDAINFESHSKGKCRKMEYMNVRGHNCTGCTSYWWQTKDPSGRNFLHHDSSYDEYEFGKTTGAVYSEDNFGWYDSDYETNKKFRCTSALIATTNHWFGGYV